MLAKLPADQKALFEAADYMEQHGHCKGTYRRRSHPEAMPAVCALGALRMATDNGADLERAAERLGFFVGNADIAEWNDAPERTPAEVVSALRGAALAPSAFQ